MFSVLMSLYIKENPNYLKCCLDSLVIQSLNLVRLLLSMMVMLGKIKSCS